ncbi:MAG: hypothetical protein F9K40_20465 [Kofleriaceae bacterium]|nr:MAG: hypothetical protein F9K40_20465 [Kofleriaceae bacterium]MBZ0231334.1 hypothetical protein [Kofleriaceae bacterium]
MSRRRLATSVMAVVVAGLAIGCGRIGYDEREDDVDAMADGIGPTDADPTDADPTDALAACPTGTVELCSGSPVCIELTERGYDTWTNAVAACAAVGRRLCTGAEWDLACPCAPALVDMFDDQGGSAAEWEWVAEESGGTAHKRGYTSCADQSTHVVTDPYDFRCCVDR